MKIRVEPPSPDTRRERVEKKLFARLAAVELAERVDAVLPPRRPSRIPYIFGAAALAAAAVLALVLFMRHDNSPGREVASPSRVVTPVNGESRFFVGDAVIDAKSDTSVEVEHGPDGAITLVLARGAVDCDVEPRHGRPPFRVLAGDVKVEVVGTRFTVTRTPSPRVDVARGKVKVTTPSGVTLVEAGESWPAITAQAEQPAPRQPTDQPTDQPTNQATDQPTNQPTEQPTTTPSGQSTANELPTTSSHPAAAPKPATTSKPSAPGDAMTDDEVSQKTYQVAYKLEDSDPKKAAQLYRAIATTSKSKSLAATALVSLAQVELEQLHDPAASLSAIDEDLRRFPKAASKEEALWVRYQALIAQGKRDEARGAAADYLREFPHGAYADRVQAK